MENVNDLKQKWSIWAKVLSVLFYTLYEFEGEECGNKAAEVLTSGFRCCSLEQWCLKTLSVWIQTQDVFAGLSLILVLMTHFINFQSLKEGIFNFLQTKII